MKYSINIILNEEGSDTFLGEIKIDKEYANKLHELECYNPKRLKEVLQAAFYHSWSMLFKKGD